MADVAAVVWETPGPRNEPLIASLRGIPAAVGASDATAGGGRMEGVAVMDDADRRIAGVVFHRRLSAGA